VLEEWEEKSSWQTDLLLPPRDEEVGAVVIFSVSKKRRETSFLEEQGIRLNLVKGKVKEG
jgi:hypothetical protein